MSERFICRSEGMTWTVVDTTGAAPATFQGRPMVGLRLVTALVVARRLNQGGPAPIVRSRAPDPLPVPVSLAANAVGTCCSSA